MHRKLLGTVLGTVAGVGVASGSAMAFLIDDGRGAERSACLIGLEASTETLEPFGRRGRRAVTCSDGAACDGDGVVNGSCRVRVRACVNRAPSPSCEARPLTSVVAIAKARGAAAAVDLALTDDGAPLPRDGSSACGAFHDLDVIVRRNADKPAAKIKLRAKGSGRDRDRFAIRCRPPPHVPPPPPCRNPASNPAAPDQLRFVVDAGASDLDLGWTGAFHGFAVPSSDAFDVCLTSCDGASDVECEVAADDHLRGSLFTVPQPLFANGVPLCLVQRFDTERPIGGTADVATGDMALSVALSTDVHLTTPAQVCPTCEMGRCTTGANPGGRCAVDGVAAVQTLAGTQIYPLSEDCLPTGLILTFDATWHLTTADTDALTSHDCETPNGPTVLPNLCGDAGCGTTCGGERCVAIVDDPTSPGGTVCRDARGGVSQNCCNADSALGCFPLEDDGTLVRHGWAATPVPPLPDATYPKVSAAVLASVTCIPRSGFIAADGTLGSPGPAALLLGGSCEWHRYPR